MINTVLTILFFLIVIGFIVLAIVNILRPILGMRGIVSAMIDVTKGWQAFANRHGLKFIPTGNREQGITGSYQGFPINISGLPHPDADGKLNFDKNSGFDTLVEITLHSPLEGMLTIQEASAGNPASSTPLPGTYTTGDPAFDKRFCVSSQPEKIASHLLGDLQMRKELVANPAYNSLQASGDRLVYRQTGLVTEVEDLQYLTDLLCKVAGDLE